MKNQKLTTVQNRALALCTEIKRHGSAAVNVEWKKSRDYGYNPVITDYRGGKCTNVSGCGFDKLSTALADALQYLGETDEDRLSIARTGGAGLFSVERALAAQGWTLTQTARWKLFDAFTITRTTRTA